MVAEPILETPNAVPGNLDAETHASTEHASSGLPQLEFQHWAGQIGYLLILFVVTYVLIAKVFAPRLRKVIDERAETIEGAITAARSVQDEAAAQADAARADVDRARADARAMAVAAKARVTEESNARLAADEAAMNERIAEAETAIAATRDSAMANVTQIATEATSAMVERLTGKSATPAELAAAIKGVA